MRMRSSYARQRRKRTRRVAGDKLAKRERDLEQRELRVVQRESSLEAYVASTQGELQRRERALKNG